MHSPSPEEILDGLDAEQHEVASNIHGPMAVIAGAGTGKTRAITHRIAYGVATGAYVPVSYTHLRAHETPEHLVCRLLLEKKKKNKKKKKKKFFFFFFNDTATTEIYT